MLKYVLYQLDENGNQPYMAVAVQGASFNGGLDKIEDYYVGTIEGTEESIASSIDACHIFNMSELSGQSALDYFGKLKYKEISDAFILQPSLGYTCRMGFKVDSTREDLKNYQDLLYYMQNNNINFMDIRINDGALRNTSIMELRIIVNELIAYGLYLYQYKWELEQAVDAATTVEEINAISWQL